MSDVKYYKVNLTESERGWGQRTEQTLFFRTEDEGKKYVKEYNDKYNSSDEVSHVPDWYIVAEGPYTVWIDEELAKLIYEDMKKQSRRRKKPQAGKLVGP